MSKLDILFELAISELKLFVVANSVFVKFFQTDPELFLQLIFHDLFFFFELLAMLFLNGKFELDHSLLKSSRPLKYLCLYFLHVYIHLNLALSGKATQFTLLLLI